MLLGQIPATQKFPRKMFRKRFRVYTGLNGLGAVSAEQLAKMSRAATAITSVTAAKKEGIVFPFRVGNISCADLSSPACRDLVYQAVLAKKPIVNEGAVMFAVTPLQLSQQKDAADLALAKKNLNNPNPFPLPDWFSMLTTAGKVSAMQPQYWNIPRLVSLYDQIKNRKGVYAFTERTGLTPNYNDISPGAVADRQYYLDFSRIIGNSTQPGNQVFGPQGESILRADIMRDWAVKAGAYPEKSNDWADKVSNFMSKAAEVAIIAGAAIGIGYGAYAAAAGAGASGAVGSGATGTGVAAEGASISLAPYAATAASSGYIAPAAAVAAGTGVTGTAASGYLSTAAGLASKAKDLYGVASAIRAATSKAPAAVAPEDYWSGGGEGAGGGAGGYSGAGFFTQTNMLIMGGGLLALLAVGVLMKKKRK